MRRRIWWTLQCVYDESFAKRVFIQDPTNWWRTIVGTVDSQLCSYSMRQAMATGFYENEYFTKGREALETMVIS